MPKGKESIDRQRKTFNKVDLNMVDIKSSIKKMSEYAASTASNQDSFRDGNEIATVAATNEKMEITPADQTVEQPSPAIKLPNFKKKVKNSL